MHNTIVTARYLRRWFIDRQVRKFNAKGRVLEIGSGKKLRYVKGSVTLNKDADSEPDIVLDAEDLPFENEFDSILVLEVLEHTQRPYDLIEQVFKALKKGGNVLITIPFCFEIHSSEDYWRFTDNGVRLLLRDFSDITITHHGRMVSVIAHYMRITLLGQLLWPVLNIFAFWTDSIIDKIIQKTPRVTLGYGITAKKP